MTFVGAVRDGFSKYVTFQGRSSRPAYWWWYLFSLVAVIVAGIIDVSVGSFVITLIVAVALFLPNLAVLVRRLHDASHTGWWVLIGFIPFGWIVLLIFALQESKPPNQWGEAPDGIATPAPAI